jgi:hypothetical protein
MQTLIQRLPELAASFDWTAAFAIFLVYTLIDAMYAWYTLAVTRHRPLAAANMAAVMYVLIACGVLSYTDNPLYVFPLACGSWLGTYLVVKRAKDAAGAVPGPGPHQFGE